MIAARTGAGPSGGSDNGPLSLPSIIVFSYRSPERQCTLCPGCTYLIRRRASAYADATERQFGCGSIGISADWDASPDRQVSVLLSRGTIAMSAARGAWSAQLAVARPAYLCTAVLNGECAPLHAMRLISRQGPMRTRLGGLAPTRGFDEAGSRSIVARASVDCLWCQAGSTVSAIPLVPSDYDDRLGCRMAGGTPEPGRRDKTPAVSCSMVSVVSAVTSACSRRDLRGLLAGRSRPRTHRAVRVMDRSWGGGMTTGPPVRAQPGSGVASDDGRRRDRVRRTLSGRPHGNCAASLSSWPGLVHDATAAGA